MDIVVLQALIAACFIAVSLWWYRRSAGERSWAAGCVLWVAWVAFGAISLFYLAASGPEAALFGGILTWAFCVAGVMLGSRLLIQASPARADDVRWLTTVFILGSGVLGFACMWLLLGSVLRS